MGSLQSWLDLVPYFDQEPVSYISYPPIEDHHINFEILLSLRPETTDGNDAENTGKPILHHLYLFF